MSHHKHIASPRKDIGLLMMRLAVGGTLFAHGTQKLFGWFGGGGLAATGEAMEGMGFRPGRLSALAAGLAEAGGGTLLALGLATPAGGAAAAANMATASSVHAPNGFFVMNGGLEHPAALGSAAAALSIAGPGRYSLDHVTGHVLDRRWMPAAALALGAVAAACVISARLRALATVEEAGGAAEEDGGHQAPAAA
jgi:putative oxidoreductase